MALINRVSRLFKADFNAVLDQIEEPELILKQAIRDMEDELAASDQALRQRLVDQENLRDRQKELDVAIAGTSEQLDLCFESGKDELARTFLRRRLEAGKLLQQLHTQAESNDKYIDDSRAGLEDKRAALESLRQKAELYGSRPLSSSDGERDAAFWTGNTSVTDDEVEVAFLREKRERGVS